MLNPPKKTEIFVDFCAANAFRILNTDFQKPAAKQATFRENTTNIGAGFAPDTHAQLDFWLTRQKQKNSCTDVQSRTDLYLNTDHYLVEMNIRVKLAGGCQRINRPAKFTKPTPTQRQDYNEAVSRSLACSTHVDEERWKNFNQSLMQPTDKRLSKEHHTKKKGYLSSNTWGLIDRRQKCYLEGKHDEVKALDRQMKRSAGRS